MRAAWLKWLERALLTAGVVLAVWCTTILIEARFFKNLPVPKAVATLPGDASSGRVPAVNVTSALLPGSWVARLEAPSLHLATTVLEGSDDDTLRKGAGHIEETAFPGQNGNIGIAGHRDTVFRQVRHLHVGDMLTLTTSDRIYRYRIGKTTVVKPDDVYVLDPAGHPTLTLVTCYPFEFIGHAPQRFIVSADLEAEDARAVQPGGAGGTGTAGTSGR